MKTKLGTRVGETVTQEFYKPESDGHLTREAGELGSQSADLVRLEETSDRNLVTEGCAVRRTGVAPFGQKGQGEQRRVDGLLNPADQLDFLDEEEWDEGVDDIEYDEPEYEKDSALVSALFRQVTDPVPTGESPIVLEEGRGTRGYRFANAPRLSSLVNNMWPVLGGVGVTAIVLTSLWWFQNREPQQIINLSPIPPLPSQTFPTEFKLKTASTSDLCAIAIEHFHIGDLSTGQRMVEELLNRGALQSASAALAAVSDLQANEPAITFLRGRLAWQSVQVGDKSYRLNDACRYWETAVKDKPNSPLHHNALGFAYYAQGNLNEANQAWFQALYLVEEQQAAKTSSSTTPTPTPSVANWDALNAYAGLALVLSKSAQNQPTEKRTKLLSEAIKLRQKVLTDDPVNFQAQTLSKNWLWTNKAIQDWRSLLNASPDF